MRQICHVSILFICLLMVCVVNRNTSAQTALIDLEASPEVIDLSGDASSTSITLIEFETRESGWVSVNVLDTNGEVVRVLLNRTNLSAGIHTFVWNGKDRSNKSVGPGYYWIKVSFDSPGSKAEEQTKVKVAFNQSFVVNGDKEFAWDYLWNSGKMMRSVFDQTLSLEASGQLADGLSVTGRYDDSTDPELASFSAAYERDGFTISGGDVATGVDGMTFISGDRRLMGFTSKYDDKSNLGVSASYGRAQALMAEEKFQMDGLALTFAFAHSPVIPISEKVFLDGELLHRDEDYIIDYGSGAIVLLWLPASGTELEVIYQYLPDRQFYRTSIASLSIKKRIAGVDVQIGAQRSADEVPDVIEALGGVPDEIPAPGQTDIIGSRIKYNTPILNIDAEVADSSYDNSAQGFAYRYSIQANLLRLVLSASRKTLDKSFHSEGSPGLKPGSSQESYSAELKLNSKAVVGVTDTKKLMPMLFNDNLNSTYETQGAYLRFTPSTALRLKLGYEEQYKDAVNSTDVASIESTVKLGRTDLTAKVSHELPADDIAVSTRLTAQAGPRISLYSQIDSSAEQYGIAGGFKAGPLKLLTFGGDGAWRQGVLTKNSRCRGKLWFVTDNSSLRWDGEANWTNDHQDVQLNANYGVWHWLGSYQFDRGGKLGSDQAADFTSVGVEKKSKDTDAITSLIFKKIWSTNSLSDSEIVACVSHSRNLNSTISIDVNGEAGHELRSNAALCGVGFGLELKAGNYVSGSLSLSQRWVAAAVFPARSRLYIKGGLSVAF